MAWSHLKFSSRRIYCTKLYFLGIKSTKLVVWTCDFKRKNKIEVSCRIESLLHVRKFPLSTHPNKNHPSVPILAPSFVRSLNENEKREEESPRQCRTCCPSPLPEERVLPFSSPRSSLTPISLVGVSRIQVISAGRKLRKNGGRMFRGHYISSRHGSFNIAGFHPRREECRDVSGTKRVRKRERQWRSAHLLVESRVIYQVLLPFPSSESSSFVFGAGVLRICRSRLLFDLRANPSPWLLPPRYQLSRRERREDNGVRHRRRVV